MFTNASLHFDIESFLGYGKPEVSGGGTSPQLLHYGLGFTLGYKFNQNYFFGLKNEFRFVDQISDLDVSTGNFRGTYLSLAGPTFGMHFNQWIVKVDFKLFNDFEFSNQTSSGNQVFLRKPFGWRLSVGYAFFQQFSFGLYYEYLEFQQSLDSGGGISNLDPAQDMSQVGLFMIWRPGNSPDQIPLE